MKTVNVAVLGANGQMGQSLFAFIKKNNTAGSWDFFASAAIDITDTTLIDQLFESGTSYDYLINLAAYTAVDSAEKEPQKALSVNAHALKYLAAQCRAHHTTLIHLSTDYVFDGQSDRPYQETDETNPVNIYGQSKREGENLIQTYTPAYFILRTGWLYSEFGHNFYLTMKKLAQEKEIIRVVSDQFGTPTHTTVIAEAILKIITTSSTAYGIYHIGNEGKASWFDFAEAILTQSGYRGKVEPICTKDFPALAQRPVYAVLDKSKYCRQFNVSLPHWKESLQDLD